MLTFRLRYTSFPVASPYQVRNNLATEDAEDVERNRGMAAD